jgi:hypothetical protein
MPIGTYEHIAGEKGDVDLTFRRFLPTGDYLTEAEAVLEGLTEDSTLEIVGEPAVSTTQVKVWLQGGAAGDQAVLKVTSTTNDGRIPIRSIRVQVKGP